MRGPGPPLLLLLVWAAAFEALPALQPVMRTTSFADYLNSSACAVPTSRAFVCSVPAGERLRLELPDSPPTSLAASIEFRGAGATRSTVELVSTSSTGPVVLVVSAGTVLAFTSITLGALRGTVAILGLRGVLISLQTVVQVRLARRPARGPPA